MLSMIADPFPAVEKIAVLRANRIGDFVVTLPALAALRATYPAAEIVLLGRPWHAEFLHRRPGPIDRVVVIPPSRGVGEGEDFVEDEVAQEQFFAAMRAEQFDLALQCHGGGRHSNPFVARLAARHTVGLRAADAPPLDRWHPYILDQPEVIRFLEVVALAGAPPTTLEPALAITAADRAEALAALAGDTRPHVAIHPGATDPRRRWPTERFAAASSALAQAGARIVLLGGPDDHPQTRDIARAVGDAAIDLAGRLSLGGTLGVLARCRLAIGNDSGPLHLAGAAGTATVGLYLGRNLFHYGPLTRVHHRPLATWRDRCPDCGATGGCEHHVSWLDEITAESVIDAARELYRLEPKLANDTR